jgi:hypothetical protein
MIELPDGKKYIGQHQLDTLETRKSSHYGQFKNYCKRTANGDKPFAGCNILYEALKQCGFEKASWHILESNVELNDLNELEDIYIQELDTIVPKGYNQRLNGMGSYGNHKVYTEETRKKMSDSQSKVYDTKLHKYRRNNEELTDLPKHVIFVQRDNKQGYCIRDHPKCKSKYFLSSTESVDSLKAKVIKFLADIEENPHVSTRQVKLTTGIPLGILERTTGYEVQVGRNNRNYSQMFTKSSNTKEENLQLAITWLKNLDAAIESGDEAKISEAVMADKKLKKNAALPKGITQIKDGYRVSFNQNKVRYGIVFTSKRDSMVDKLRQATEWMDNKKKELANPPQDQAIITNPPQDQTIIADPPQDQTIIIADSQQTKKIKNNVHRLYGGSLDDKKSSDVRDSQASSKEDL